MSPTLGAAAIAFLAAMLGGLIQAGFTSLRERRSFRWNMSRENYGLFLQSVAGKAVNPIGTPERIPYEQMGIEATAKILLQGSPEVVRALNVYQAHGILDSEQGFLDFGRLTEAMRADVGGQKMTDFPALVRSILFEDPR